MLTKTTIQIEGMSCGMCEAHINETLRRSFKVISVKSSHRKKKAEMISDYPVDEQKLRTVITDLGYKIIGIQKEDYVKKDFDSIKIWVGQFGTPPFFIC